MSPTDLAAKVEQLTRDIKILKAARDQQQAELALGMQE